MRTLQAKKKDVKGEIEHRNNQKLIHKGVKDLAALEKDEDGVYQSTNYTTIVGLDPGKKSAATWLYHDPVKQLKHQKWNPLRREMKQAPQERYESNRL